MKQGPGLGFVAFGVYVRHTGERVQLSAGRLDWTVGERWRLGREIINEGMGSKILDLVRSPGKNLPKKEEGG